MNELLPCPFCGGEAEVQHQSRELYGDVVDWYGVYCMKQFCGFVSGQSTEAEAIEAWNTRADDYRQAAEYWQRMYEEKFAERTCYADEVTHRDCKYSVNRGWRERTCRNISDEYNEKEIGATSFCCSECGAHYEDAECYYAFLASDDGITHWCPSCGAKVVSE